MSRKAGFSTFIIALIAGLCSLFWTHSAQARNVPGSASAAIGTYSEASSAAIMGGIMDGVLRVRGDDRREQVTLSFSGASMVTGATPTAGSFQFLGENGFGGVVNLGYRDLDNADINADLFTGSALLLYRPTSDLLVFGGVIGESGSGRTPYNSGTIKSRGIGGAFGADMRLQNGISLTAALAYLALDYDVTRSGGAFTGSFNAGRYMAELQASNIVELSDDNTLIWNGGLRYLRQNNDGYVESGGAVIGKTSHEAISALAGARLLFGASGARPFIEGDLRYDISQSSSLPLGVFTPTDERAHVRLGGGVLYEKNNTSFEAGIGMHATENGYDGFDGRIRVLIRF